MASRCISLEKYTSHFQNHICGDTIDMRQPFVSPKEAQEKWRLRVSLISEHSFAESIGAVESVSSFFFINLRYVHLFIFWFGLMRVCDLYKIAWDERRNHRTFVAHCPRNQNFGFFRLYSPVSVHPREKECWTKKIGLVMVDAGGIPGMSLFSFIFLKPSSAVWIRISRGKFHPNLNANSFPNISCLYAFHLPYGIQCSSDGAPNVKYELPHKIMLFILSRSRVRHGMVAASAQQ